MVALLASLLLLRILRVFCNVIILSYCGSLGKIRADAGNSILTKNEKETVLGNKKIIEYPSPVHS